MLPSRLRTGPFTAAVTRRTEASVSSACSWQFEQRMFVGPRVRSLNRCAPKSASRLMWFGLVFVQGFSAGSVAVGVLAAEAVPRRVVGDQRRLVQLDREAEEEGEVVLDAACTRRSPRSSSSAFVDDGRRCRPAFTRISFVASSTTARGRPPGSSRRSVERRGPGCGQRLSGPSTLSVGETCCLASGRTLASRLPSLRLRLRQRRGRRRARAARRGHLEVADDRRHRLRREAGVHQLRPRTSTGSLRIVGAEDPGVRDRAAEVVDAVEDVLGAAIPELAVVEHGVDHRRRVARLDAAGVRRSRSRSRRGSSLVAEDDGRPASDTTSLLSVAGSSAPRTPGMASRVSGKSAASSW